ncbi:MAG: 50S ribosomal protein L9 [Actinomycetes bacterium]
MKLILTQEVSGLGTPGDVVEVKDGYGRNYLLPRGLATAWTKGGEKQVDAIRRARQAREVATLDEAQAIKAALEGKRVRLPVKAGQSGRLFGSVTPADVAAAVKESVGRDIDRRKVEIDQPIKSLGAHTVQVRLHPDVQATVDLEVVAAS